jgi:O-antigen/teichoic acid export membrane protein
MKQAKKTSVKVNIFYQMLYEVLALSLPLITAPYISRVLGAEKIGIYSFTYSIAAYFGMFSMLGVKNHGNREIAKNREDKNKVSVIFCSIYFIQFLMSCLMVSVYIIYVSTLSVEFKNIFWIQLIYIFSYMLDINWLFFGLELFKYTSIRNIIIKIATFAATFLFVRNSDDLWKYCLVLAVGALASEGFMWACVRTYIRLGKPQKDIVLANIKPMLVMFIPVLATSLYNIMDKIMLGSLSSKIQLGFYENSEKITNCVKTVILSVGTVMMPRMSMLAAKNDAKKAERYMGLSIEIIMFCAFSFSFGIAAVAHLFAPLYWGNEFAQCDVLLVGLCVALPFSAFGNFIRTQYMIPHGMDRQYITAVIVSAGVNAVANLLLIPLLGAEGAVVGTVIAEGGVCIIQGYFVRKNMELKTYIKKSVPYMGFGMVMYMAVKFLAFELNDSVASLIVQILLGATIYVLLTVIYMKYSKNELLEGLINRYRRRK